MREKSQERKRLQKHKIHRRSSEMIRDTRRGDKNGMEGRSSHKGKEEQWQMNQKNLRNSRSKQERMDKERVDSQRINRGRRKGGKTAKRERENHTDTRNNGIQ